MKGCEWTKDKRVMIVVVQHCSFGHGRNNNGVLLYILFFFVVLINFKDFVSVGVRGGIWRGLCVFAATR